LNNPLKYTDPSGWLIDDYGLDQWGEIRLLRKTEDNFDRLIVLDNIGKETDKFIQFDKGILNNKLTYSRLLANDFNDDDAMDALLGHYDYFVLKNETVAKNLFTFVADNAKVEWTLVKTNFDKGTMYLSTSHKTNREKSFRQLYNVGLIKGDIMEHIHNHPIGWNITPSNADINFVKSTNLEIDRFKQTKYFIYKDNYYLQYDHNYKKP
jgi:hypothetical protein